MKVRLYRGPADGKIIDIAPTETSWMIRQLADPKRLYADDLSDVKTVDALYVRTKHTHPDGSVYFEWDKPKGTKSGIVGVKKKKRANGGLIINTAPYNTTTTGSTIVFDTSPYSLGAP